MVFAGYSGFLHYVQLASHELATIGINVTKNEIQIQIQVLIDVYKLDDLTKHFWAQHWSSLATL